MDQNQHSIYDQNVWNTISLGAGDTYMAQIIREFPPPHTPT